MTANIGFNYMPTTNAAGTFIVTSSGGVQGMFIDDPAVRYQLKGGVLATTETIPMWGGVGINVTTLPNTGTNPPDGTQGGLITRATNITTGAASQLVGFSVFNQAYGMVNTPQSPVPLAASNMQVNYFLLGTNARIYLNVAPSLAASLEGGSIAQQVSWDYVNQWLSPYVAAYAAVATGGIIVGTYTASTGILSLTFSTAPLGASIGAAADGAYLNIAGITQTGTAVVNGSFPIVSTGTSGTVINLQTAAGAGASTLTVSSATLAAGGGALPCSVEEFLIGNSMTVSYNSTTLNATWATTGSVAIVKI